MKKIVFIFLGIIYSKCMVGQSSEMGIFLGISGYKGELNQTMFNPKLINFPALGFQFRRCMSNHWAFKMQANYGKIDGADSLSDDEFQQYRNLSFKSHIIEGTFQFEFNFFKFQTANTQTSFSPYLFMGLSFFHFNPKANLDGQWYDLQPLGTEGQGTNAAGTPKAYKRFTASIPLGGGIKFRLSRRITGALEVGVRRAYSDYIDDVSTNYADYDAISATHGTAAAQLSDRSVDQATGTNIHRQRGNANDKDWYYFAGLQLNYVLSNKYGDVCKPFRQHFK